MVDGFAAIREGDRCRSPSTSTLHLFDPQDRCGDRAQAN